VRILEAGKIIFDEILVKTIIKNGIFRNACPRAKYL
jgi:hypothetical protein